MKPTIRQKLGTGIFFFVICGVFLTSCSQQEREYLYKKQDIPENRKFSVVHKISSMVGPDSLDVLWVIDNSASMSEEQASVIQNTQRFMTDFILTPAIHWKMGMVSTDTSDPPYVGFAPGDELNEKTPNPVQKFQSAVSRLGIGGDGIEKSFDPISNAFTQYPKFLTPGGVLAIVIVSDEQEQSQKYNEKTFYQYLLGLKNNDASKVATYFVLSTVNPTGCTSNEVEAPEQGGEYIADPFRYTRLAQLSGGKIYSIGCLNFGDILSSLGKDILHKLTAPRLLLNDRPIVSTIKVTYYGKDIKGGPKEDGGSWTYDYDSNALIFHDLSFVDRDNAEVEVHFDADDGWPN